MRHRALAVSIIFLAACSNEAPPNLTAPSPSAPRPGLSKLMVRPNVSVRILKGLTGATDNVTAFNDSDIVVGIRDQGATHLAFDWSKATGVQIMPVMTGWNSEAFGINDVGTVVGDVSNSAYPLPARWLGGTNLQTMQVQNPGDTLATGKPSCVVYGINASGLMTGSCLDPYSWWNVAEWNANGIVQSFCSSAIDCPVTGWGYAINSRGVIAGGDEWHLFNLNALVIAPPATLDTLGGLDQTKLDAGYADIGYAINDAGIVAGVSWLGTSPCDGDPVVWPSPSQKPIDIGVKLCGQANGIDNNNNVIGTMTAGGNQAFIYSKATGTQALPGLGGSNESSTAVAINNKREVLGTITSSGVKYDVIWTF